MQDLFNKVIQKRNLKDRKGQTQTGSPYKHTQQGREHGQNSKPGRMLGIAM